MSTLTCRVRQTLPFACVSLSGTLDDSSMIETGLVLRDCLAAQPVALVLDVADLRIEGTRAFGWLREIGREAGVWPGCPVILGDPGEALSDLGDLRFATLAAAREAAAALPVPRRAELLLPPQATSCAAARELVRDVCEGWGKRRYMRLAELIVDELVANVVIHAGTEMWVCVRDLDGLQISVSDGDPRRVAPGAVGDDRGHGLEIVDGLAAEWGCLPTATGKVTWVRIERSAHQTTRTSLAPA
jgi:anti-sigma regulatory factor (Ser/Thr protein kinase)